MLNEKDKNKETRRISLLNECIIGNNYGLVFCLFTYNQSFQTDLRANLYFPEFAPIKVSNMFNYSKSHSDPHWRCMYVCLIGNAVSLLMWLLQLSAHTSLHLPSFLIVFVFLQNDYDAMKKEAFFTKKKLFWQVSGCLDTCSNKR